MGAPQALEHAKHAMINAQFCCLRKLSLLWKRIVGRKRKQESAKFSEAVAVHSGNFSDIC